MGGTGCGENWVLLWWTGPSLPSRSLIQFSPDVWGCASSLIVVLSWPSPGVYRLYGRASGHHHEDLRWMHLQDCCCQRPCPRSRPLPAHTSTGDPQTCTGRSGSASCRVAYPFPWALVHARSCLCPPRGESLFLPVLCKSCNQAGLQSHIPWGSPVPLLDSQAGNCGVGPRTFTTVQELLWFYCSPVCGLPT